MLCYASAPVTRKGTNRRLRLSFTPLQITNLQKAEKCIHCKLLQVVPGLHNVGHRLDISWRPPTLTGSFRFEIWCIHSSSTLLISDNETPSTWIQRINQEARQCWSSEILLNMSLSPDVRFSMYFSLQFALKNYSLLNLFTSWPGHLLHISSIFCSLAAPLCRGLIKDQAIISVQQVGRPRSMDSNPDNLS